MREPIEGQFIGVDVAAPGSETTVLAVGGRQFGKTEVQRRLVADFTRRHPDAVVAYWGAGGVRFEKPVKAVEREALPPPE